MTKLEKVIKGLECLAKQHGIVGVCEPENCPYGDLHTCANEIARDAIALLKAQEPREPYYTKLEYIVNGMPVTINHPECPRCHDNGFVLWDAEIEKGAAYCKRCGQAVKWE